MPMNAATANIKHVVVLMMENRSYDHLLFDYPHGANKGQEQGNTAAGKAYPQHAMAAGAPMDLVIDDKRAFGPKHEFENVARQIGLSANQSPVSMSGFAEDARLTLEEIGVNGSAAEPWIEKVMEYVPFGASAAQDPLPAFQGLARHFSVCDRWYSSMPGPTWPNRFFALMGTCRGRVRMPSNWQETGQGIATFFKEVCAESIFSLMDKSGISHKLYADCATPLAFMIKDAGTRETIAQFALDVANNDLPQFCWIEPDYGLLGPHGNSQHPPEDLRYGDAFIARVFNAITANHQVWSNTLFVLLYDEHGGFYDRMPPRTTAAPDNIPADVSVGGQPFDFTLTGLRVPAILASPWITPGPMAFADPHTFYDHTSLLAFLCDLYHLDKSKLGNRTAQAAHFGTNQAVWAPALRQDLLSVQLTPPPLPKPHRLLKTYETELGTETRQLIQATHAYVTGANPASAATVTPSRALTTPGRPAAAPVAIRDLPGLPSAQQLGAMGERVVQLLHAAAPLHASPPTAAAQQQASKPDRPLKILALHGVGHSDASGSDWRIDPDWQTHWSATIHAQLATIGLAPPQVHIDFLCYDDLFGDGPTLLQIAKGLGSLADLLNPLQGAITRDLKAADFDDLVRWTAGMTIQWLEDERLRDALVQRLLSRCSGDSKPDLVLAHSLGSLIAYDAFRRQIAQGKAALLDGTLLATFGSQIAHPVVVREVWGGLVQPLHDQQAHGIARWFHLHNPHDKVFTRPIPVPDSGRSDIESPFTSGPLDGLFSANHAGELYLGSKGAARDLWPALAQRQQLQMSLPRSIASAARIRTVGAARRRALLVGINRYPDPASQLSGCVNDVYLMSALLQESGYASADIRILTDHRATRDAMLEHLRWLVADARAGDERVLFYSGHGAQVPMYGNGGYADHLCETLVPFDFDWNDPDTYFTDKEFHNFYSHLPFGGKRSDSAHLIVVLDCCHAAGMTRAGGAARSLAMPPDIRHRMLQWDPKAQHWHTREFIGLGQARSFTEAGGATLMRGWSAQGSSYGCRPINASQFAHAKSTYGHAGPYLPTLIYAAKQSQLASECIVGQVHYGAFTHALVNEIRAARDQAPRTFAAMIEHVANDLKAAEFGQTPELVAPTEVRQQLFPWR